jgi:hypothetical protein
MNKQLLIIILAIGLLISNTFILKAVLSVSDDSYNKINERLDVLTNICMDNKR